MGDLGRIYNWFNDRTNLGPAAFNQYMNGSLVPLPQSLQTSMTLYYRVTISNTDLSTNAVVMRFTTIPEQTSYKGMEIRYMMDQNGNQNQNLLTFIGYRVDGATITPASGPPIVIPSQYNETVQIKTPDGSFISALTFYEDTGSGFITEGVPFIDYTVEASSGIFAGYRNMRIYFNNVNFTRQIVLTR